MADRYEIATNSENLEKSDKILNDVPKEIKSSVPFQPLGDCLEGKGAPSVFLVITGPSGCRLLIPMRKLKISYNKEIFGNIAITLLLSRDAGQCLIDDIEKWQQKQKQYNL